MTKVDKLRRYLVTIHQKGGDPEERFIGNGGIVVNPDGTRSLVTAGHVVFEKQGQRDVIVLGDSDIATRIRNNPQFVKVPNRDLAEMKLPDGPGIPVASEFKQDQQIPGLNGLRMIGSRGRLRYNTRLLCSDPPQMKESSSLSIVAVRRRFRKELKENAKSLFTVIIINMDDQLEQKEALGVGLQIFPESQTELIQLFESSGLIYQPILERTKSLFALAQSATERLKLQRTDKDLETQVRNAKTMLNMAFLRKEKQENPDRNIVGLLEKIHNGGAEHQHFVNLLTTAENLYYDQDGNHTTLEGYLQSYYRALVGKGFKISVIHRPVSVVLEQKQKYDPETLKQIEYVAQTETDVPVIELEYQGRSTSIPVLYSSVLSETNASASYEWSTSEEGTPHDEVIYSSGGKSIERQGASYKSFCEQASSLVHEIDHAVYNFLHDSKLRKNRRAYLGVQKQVSKLSDDIDMGAISGEGIGEVIETYRNFVNEASRLNNELIYLRFLNRIGEQVVMEGLAKQAQDAFLLTQAEGLSEYSDLGKDLVQVVELIPKFRSLLAQSAPKLLQYSIGEVLTTIVSLRSDFTQLYLSDSLDEQIVNNPALIRVLMRHFALNHADYIVGINDMATNHQRYAPYSMDDYKSRVRDALAGNEQVFILGKTYFDMLEQVEDNTRKMSSDELDSRIELLKEKSPHFFDSIKGRYPDTDDGKRQLLNRLEVVVGSISDAFEKEFNKLFR